MAAKKTPAPRRAGSTDRQQREIAVAAQLEMLRTEDPAVFARLMRLLAKLVTESATRSRTCKDK